MATERLLLQFSREPIAGRVKTRLIPALGAEGACELHEQLTRWTCQSLLRSTLAPVDLVVAGNAQHPLFQQCREAGVRDVRCQVEGDLGQRMWQALADGLESSEQVVLVGSDCPQLDAAYLAGAFAALSSAPVVLGPATDGGYVLVGVRADARRDWFAGVEWGSDKVLAQTLQRLRNTGTPWELLPPRADIDRPEDLPLWREMSASG